MKLHMRGKSAVVGAFSHLLLGGKSAKKAEEKKEDPAEATEEDPDAEDEDDQERGPKKDPEGENPDPDAEDEEEEDTADEEVASVARAEERARCRAIFAAPEAAGNVALAAHLAFDTDQTAAQAVATLKLGGKSSASGLGARMSAAPNPSLGSGGASRPGAGSAEANAANIMGAYRKATGKAS